MAAHIIITVTVIILLGFELNSARAAYLIGEEIGGPAGARHIQDAVTPPLSANLGILIQLSFLACIVAGFFVHGWVIGLVLIPTSILALGVVKKILPSPQGAFYRGIIVRSMMARYADFVKGGDTIRANAMKDLIQRLGYPLPPAFRQE